MHLTSLANTPFDEIVDCFLQAFENYYVTMPTDKEYYRKRWQAAGVDFEHSFGMFDGSELVAFVLHAVDFRQGKRIAFNTGTGVLAHYRRKGHVKTLMETALIQLAHRGLTLTQLEVITKNEGAVELYKTLGYRIQKHYLCFSGNLEVKAENAGDVREISIGSMNWDGLPNQQLYSWDNQKEALLRGEYTCFQIRIDGETESYFIGHKTQNYVAQFEILRPSGKAWERLFGAVVNTYSNLRINNVDATLSEKTHQIHHFGLAPTVEQFEMVLDTGAVRK